MNSRSRRTLTFFTPFDMSQLSAYAQGGTACHILLWDLVNNSGDILLYSNWRGRLGATDLSALADKNNMYDHGARGLLPCVSVKAFPHLFKRLQCNVSYE